MPAGFNKGVSIPVHNPKGINRSNENEVRYKQAFCIEIISFTGDYYSASLGKQAASCFCVFKKAKVPA